MSNGLRYDVVELHSRRVTELQMRKNNTTLARETLVFRIAALKDGSILRSSLLLKLGKCTELQKEREKKHRQQLDTEVALLRLELVKRKQHIDEETKAIIAQQLHIRNTEAGADFNEYLLDAIPYLNSHHTDVAELERMRKEINEKNTMGIAEAKANIRENTKRYVEKFYPELIERDGLSSINAMETDPTVCSKCPNGVVAEVRDSHYVCTTCGVVSPQCGYSIRNAESNVDWEELQGRRERKFWYLPLNHFRELMRQVQGLSQGNIPDEIYESLQEQFRKYRVPPENITSQRVRSMLKRIGKAKYYEHREAITQVLNPVYQPIRIKPEHEEKLALMFVQLQPPFNKLKLQYPNRKNFLSYPFTLFKLNELNGWDEYNTRCDLLKSVELINKQDMWWGLMMKELGWEVVGRTFDVHSKPLVDPSFVTH
jgi:hypothetical protein